MKFIAQELREIMAELGFRTIDEMVGRSDKLEMNSAIDHWKTKGLDFSSILYQPEVPEGGGLYCQIEQNHNIEKSKDLTELLDLCQPALDKAEKVEINTTIKNVNRVVGTIIGNEVTKRYGEAGLPEDTITLNLKGSSGQSLGAFIPQGITIKLEGDANGLLWQRLIRRKNGHLPAKATFVPEDNGIVGNVALYGATQGEAYIRGAAGERFLLSATAGLPRWLGRRRSWLRIHDRRKGCYPRKNRPKLCGGDVGGIAYVLDMDESFCESCNTDMVDLVKITDAAELAEQN